MDTDEDLALALRLQSEEDDNVVAMKTPADHASLSPVDPSWEYLDPIPDIRAMFLQFNDQYFWGRLAGIEVRWSPRMTLCAGLCCYEGRGGLCSVRLSVPLLKLRPRKDLVQTLLHEMIHAYLFVTDNNKDHDGHGPEFHKHMYRINKETGASISVYHTFHDEVDNYRQHWWRCTGPCQQRRPYYGYVKRAMNRAPSERDRWWNDHKNACNGTYVKVKEPENYGKKKKGAESESTESKSSDKGKDSKKNMDIRTFIGKGHVLNGTEKKDAVNGVKMPKGKTPSATVTSGGDASTSVSTVTKGVLSKQSGTKSTGSTQPKLAFTSVSPRKPSQTSNQEKDGTHHKGPSNREKDGTHHKGPSNREKDGTHHKGPSNREKDGTHHKGPSNREKDGTHHKGPSNREKDGTHHKRPSNREKDGTHHKGPSNREKDGTHHKGPSNREKDGTHHKGPSNREKDGTRYTSSTASSTSIVVLDSDDENLSDICKRSESKNKPAEVATSTGSVNTGTANVRHTEGTASNGDVVSKVREMWANRFEVKSNNKSLPPLSRPKKRPKESPPERNNSSNAKKCRTDVGTSQSDVYLTGTGPMDSASQPQRSDITHTKHSSGKGKPARPLHKDTTPGNSISSQNTGSVTSPSSQNTGSVTSPSSQNTGSVTSPSSQNTGSVTSPDALPFQDCPVCNQSVLATDMNQHLDMCLAS